mgnify:CR=1 FL=1
MGKTLYQKVWEAHTAGTLPDGRTQLFIATMYLHEVTSPQAFAMLRELGLPVLHPERLKKRIISQFKKIPTRRHHFATVSVYSL